MLLETIAAGVHNAWWKQKLKDGYHAPLDCKSNNRKDYLESLQQRFEDAGLDEKTYRWCDKCHFDMYPYEELPEKSKEYDRITAKAVLETLKEEGYKLTKEPSSRFGQIPFIRPEIKISSEKGGVKCYAEMSIK